MNRTPAARSASPQDAVRWKDLLVSAAGHQVPVRLFRPARPSGGWLVWAHGGSWQRGSPAQWHEVTADLARFSGSNVVSVAYRLAPEHSHPAALLDVLAATGWARREAARESGAAPVAVGGDSAGATLAAAAALVLRDAGQPLAGQFLAYPPIDPACGARSYRADPDAFPSAEQMRAAWRAYRGSQPVRKLSGPNVLYSTPLEAQDVTGVAPAVLAVGDLDPVADDVRAYAHILRQAGVETSLRFFPRTPHAALLIPAPQGPDQPHPMRQWLGRMLAARFRTVKTTNPYTYPYQEDK
ncbi:alpha/beta hydrolase fold domain-containing protein [Streptomyces chilikensis]|uniref:alpha/beta hydrolase fold domain-containing protein n=1 Tax=Streptomyces chilikensis TaxID=1194079 RepID=UPI001F1068C0|nr:alpha/beta hydrolase fold domain-containing protein [Streptomyces chilikensis]